MGYEAQNLEDGNRTTLVGGPGNQFYGKLNGEFAVYRDDSSGVRLPYYKKIWSSDPPVEIVAEDNATLSGYTIIHDKTVLVSTEGWASIYIFEIGKDTYARKIIGENGNVIVRPRLFGDLLVWADNRNGTFDIYGLYLSKENAKPFQITDDDTTDESIPGKATFIL